MRPIKHPTVFVPIRFVFRPDEFVTFAEKALEFF